LSFYLFLFLFYISQLTDVSMYRLAEVEVAIFYLRTVSTNIVIQANNSIVL
ncbi:hypothetical protein T4E_2412, partial [Trichinella pseudospiralis]